MHDIRIPRATLGRLPDYLRYLSAIQDVSPNISATRIARELGYGEVQVRKDLAAVSGQGRPRIGYDTADLIRRLEQCLNRDNCCKAVIVGAGKLGRALLDYEGFSDYGLDVAAAFDTDVNGWEMSPAGKPIYPMNRFEIYCRQNTVGIGVIAVPKSEAQRVCDRMVEAGIPAILNFAPVSLKAPPSVALRQEDLALSMAYLRPQTPVAAAE